MNIFKEASIQKLRFASIRGLLNTEQLWDLPLTSKVNFDLDSVAREANQALKAVGEESFVSTKTDPAKAQLELALKVVKEIIADKLAQAEVSRKAIANRAERARLTEILNQKQDSATQELSVEEIQERIKQLSNE